MSKRLAIKDHIRESRIFNERSVISLVVAGILILIIISRLIFLQIISHEHFATLSDENRIDFVATPPTRGLIYDRNGVVLAQNLPSFSLELIPELVPNIDRTIEELGKHVAISNTNIKRFKSQLKQKRSFNSIPIRFHLNDEEVARFAVNRHLFPGVDIQARLIRDYPQGQTAVHAIGYVGRINENELRTVDPSNYSATLHIGKTGIEKQYEGILHGRVGYKQIETNAVGRTLRTLAQTPSVPGQNIYLTLDIRLQKIAEKALGSNRGAIVAIKPDTGEVLAFASMPTYDPNPFVIGIDQKSYQALQRSIDKPLFNRALRGQYPPGSTIKPFIGLAGLEYYTTRINSTSFCPGWFTLEGDDHKYRDWKREGHGLTSLERAITESCDVYFYDLALSLGIDRIHDFLDKFGFGRRSGLDLPGERPGLLPSREWKRSQRHEPWYPGETLITGIGQGFNLATPLQLASATATLSNRGIYIQPRMVYAFQRSDDSEMDILEPIKGNPIPIENSKHWTQIINAMQRVVHHPRGTAFKIHHTTGYNIAGKTGTAQVFGIKQEEEYVKENISARLRDHALFIAFAPVDQPEIAIAVIIENGGGGGSVAAPAAKLVIDAFMKKFRL
ncbi:MAG: penicillin-binding protein 2 [Gammaproteobacteria bacterium]